MDQLWHLKFIRCHSMLSVEQRAPCEWERVVFVRWECRILNCSRNEITFATIMTWKCSRDISIVLDSHRLSTCHKCHSGSVLSRMLPNGNDNLTNSLWCVINPKTTIEKKTISKHLMNTTTTPFRFTLSFVKSKLCLLILRLWRHVLFIFSMPKSFLAPR